MQTLRLAVLFFSFFEKKKKYQKIKKKEPAATAAGTVLRCTQHMKTERK